VRLAAQETGLGGGQGVGHRSTQKGEVRRSGYHGGPHRPAFRAAAWPPAASPASAG
jgi:hypothetical protein